MGKTPCPFNGHPISGYRAHGQYRKDKRFTEESSGASSKVGMSTDPSRKRSRSPSQESESFQYASRSLRAPTAGRHPVQACRDALTSKGFDCVEAGLEARGQWNGSTVVQARVRAMFDKNVLQST